jgi:nucleoside-diphosphate-sugar epimerase
MRVLVIGGTRFIGPHVVRRLRELGADVTLLHRTNCGDATHIHADRSQAAGRWDAIVDMFAMTEGDAKAIANVEGRVVVASSADVYRQYDRMRGQDGTDSDPLPLPEDAPLRVNLFPYGGEYEKILVERVIRERGGTILRLPAVYGQGDQRMREWIGAIVSMSEAQSHWRWTRGYVENVADAIALATVDERAAGKVYNVGDVDAPTEWDWVEMLGGRVNIVKESPLPFDWRYALVTDTSAIRRDLGYAERVPREEAIARTIALKQ